MSDDMLICFDSPAAANVKNQEKVSHRNGLSSPLIPCPSTPFDLVSSQRGDDPFEPQFTDQYGLKVTPRFDKTRKTPERSLLAPPVIIDIPAIDAATPSPLLLRRAMSDVDISGVVPGQFLVSSTPLVSNANTPTRSSHALPRRSVLSGDESMSALVRSKLDLINKVKQNLAADGNPGMSRSKSISNLPETLSTSVQHKIFRRSNAVVLQEQSEVTRERRSANFSLQMNSSRANCSSFMFDQDEVTKHETSAYLSFLTSPKHKMVRENPTPEQIRKEAQKMQTLFSLCAADDYIPPKEEGEEEEEGCEWLTMTCLTEAWFDDCLDFDDLINIDSDEDEKVIKSKRVSTKDEMEAIKVRLNRFRRSIGADEDKPVKEPKEEGPIVESAAAPVSKPEAVEVVEAPPVVVPAVVPKMPLVPELKSKASNTAPVRKGPLKAVEPVPNMVKKSLSSDLLKNKPTLARGRQARPSSEQGSRRPSPSSARRSNSISPNRSAPLPAKNARLPSKVTDIKPKNNQVTGKGKENRV